jgi:hypothetical protein
MDTCPPDEEIAAFLDDMLSPEDRERITAHLASCESCYEVFAGAIHFHEDEGSGVDTTGGVIPFPFAGETDRTGVSLPPVGASEKVPRASRWLALAASILVVPALGFLAWRTLSPPPTMEVAQLVEPVKDDAGVTSYLYQNQKATYRSGGESESILWERPSFMAGVYLIDLRLSIQFEDVDSAEHALQDLGSALKDIPMMGPAAESYFQLRDKLEPESVGSLRRLVPETLRAERGLEENLSAFDSFSFGLWAEAGRLAASTHSPEFFKDRNNRRFLSHLFKQTPWAWDEFLEEVPGDLQAIQQIWEAGDLDSEDYSALSDHFKNIIDAYNSSDEL